MKKLLVFAVLAFVLAAHGAVTVMTIFPQPALADCSGQNC